MARYVCPECGVGGGHHGPPFSHNARYKCHVCVNPVLMLEANNDMIFQSELDRTDLITLEEYARRKNN